MPWPLAFEKTKSRCDWRGHWAWLLSYKIRLQSFTYFRVLPDDIYRCAWTYLHITHQQSWSVSWGLWKRRWSSSCFCFVPCSSSRFLRKTMMQGRRQQSVTQSVNQLLYWLILRLLERVVIGPFHRHCLEYLQNTAPSGLTRVDCADIQNVVETHNASVRQRDDGIAAPSHLTLVNCQMDCANIQNVAKTQLACTRQHDDSIAIY